VERHRDAGTDLGCPKALPTFKFCAASLRESWTSRTVVTLLLLGLGLALAGSLWLGRPLGCFARSASASVARHSGPFQEDICVGSTTYWHFIGCAARNTLGRAVPAGPGNPCSQESRFLKPANPVQGDLVASEPFGRGSGKIVPERGKIDAGVVGFLNRVRRRRWCSANSSSGLGGHSPNCSHRAVGVNSQTSAGRHGTRLHAGRREPCLWPRGGRSFPAGYSHLWRRSQETAPAPRLARRSAAGAGTTASAGQGL